MGEHNDMVTHKTDKPHSFEVGKSGRRMKLYFNSLVELEGYLKACINMGLLDTDDVYSAERGVGSDGKSN